MFRRASLFPLTFFFLFGGCAYLFPSCATIPGCPDGQFLCTNLNCSDPNTDPFNCGGCADDGGRICAAGQVCAAGACACGASDETMIQGRCFALDIDPANCGAVGVVCATNHVCFDGGCTCPLAAYLDSGTVVECPAGSDAGTCTDLQNDPGNCGGCGNDCDGGACLGGTCVTLSGTDAGPDAGVDAGPDAGIDGGADAGPDAGVPDAGDGG